MKTCLLLSLLLLAACGGSGVDQATLKRLLVEAARCDTADFLSLTGSATSPAPAGTDTNLTLHLLSARSVPWSFSGDTTRFQVADGVPPTALAASIYGLAPADREITDGLWVSLLTAERIGAIAQQPVGDGRFTGTAIITGPLGSDQRPLWQGTIDWTAAGGKGSWRLERLQGNLDSCLERQADGRWLPRRLPMFLPRPYHGDAAVAALFTTAIDPAIVPPALPDTAAGLRDLDGLAGANRALWPIQLDWDKPRSGPPTVDVRLGGEQARMKNIDDRTTTLMLAETHRRLVTAFAARRTELLLGLVADAELDMAHLGFLLQEVGPVDLRLLCAARASTGGQTGAVVLARRFDPAIAGQVVALRLQSSLGSNTQPAALDRRYREQTGAWTSWQFLLTAGDLTLSLERWDPKDRTDRTLLAERRRISDFIQSVPGIRTGRPVLCVSPEVPLGLVCTILDASAVRFPDRSMELLLPDLARHSTWPCGQVMAELNALPTGALVPAATLAPLTGH
jgi:hypothetical protein